MKQSTKDRRLLVAGVLDALFLGAGVLMFLRTGEVAWAVGGFILSSVPLVYVLVTNARAPTTPESTASGVSIVENSRERG